MRKPGVLVIHDRYQRPGGEDAVVAAEIALLRENGHPVTEFLRENSAIADCGAVHKALLGVSAVWNHRAYSQLRRLIRTTRPSIAHCHNLFPLISPAAYYACREEGVPVVQTLHNFRLRCPAGTMFRGRRPCDDCGSGLWYGVAHACYRNSRKQSAVATTMLGFHRTLGTFEHAVNAYSAPSRFCANRMADGGLPRQKITVRPNFLGSDPGARHASENFALFVGRLCEEKGIRELLRAWRRMPRIPLVIVGDGPLREESKREARNDVTFLGQLPQKETIARMKAARFLVFPSIAYETFGMTVLEAAACGVATIGSRLGAIPELIHEGRTGLLFDPQDPDELIEKVQWAWSHPMRMNEMGIAARQRFLRYYSAIPAYQLLVKFYCSVSSDFEVDELTGGAVA